MIKGHACTMVVAHVCNTIIIPVLFMTMLHHRACSTAHGIYYMAHRLIDHVLLSTDWVLWFMEHVVWPMKHVLWPVLHVLWLWPIRRLLISFGVFNHATTIIKWSSPEGVYTQMPGEGTDNTRTEDH